MAFRGTVDILWVSGWVLTQEMCGITCNITRSINSYIEYWVIINSGGDTYPFSGGIQCRWMIWILT